MAAYLEVWRPERVQLVVLDGLETGRLTVGRAPSNNVVTTDMRTSRFHALFEAVAGAWCVTDLSSRNGTFVNGERTVGSRPLRSGDEIRAGETRFVFRSDEGSDTYGVTEGVEKAPELTRRERDVLTALFRPALSGNVFTEPASAKEIAAALSVTEAAVKQHLLRLYDKFGIYEEEGERRRVRLANEALNRGAVSLAEVRKNAAEEPPSQLR